MKSSERRNARYQRRKAAREASHVAAASVFGNLEDVFSYAHLYKAAEDCCRGVKWKGSTQMFLSELPANIAKLRAEVLAGTWRTKGFFHFNIMERGKLRHISSVHISERTLQRCLCDNLLVPLFYRAFIYDNAASLKGKGIDFSLRRLKTHLHRHFRHHGATGYVLVFDFTDFFGSAPHEPIFKEIIRRIPDPRLQKLTMDFISNYGDVGLGLGSQVSQISALMVANRIDHFIKETLRCKYYGRYMDDGYLISESKEYLEDCRRKLQEECTRQGLVLNLKKTRIIPLASGFRFLKTKFVLLPTGKIIMKPNAKAVKKMREKLHKFTEWIKAGVLTLQDVTTSYMSWKGHVRRCNAYKLQQGMRDLFIDLYGKNPLCKSK